MGSSPTPPDPMQTSMMQGIFNLEAAKEQQGLNMTNQVTPYGNLTYSATPHGSGSGLFGPIDQPGSYTATTTLSPEMERLFQQNVTNAQLSGQIGEQLERNVFPSASKPLDLGWSATEANLDALNRQRLDPLWQQKTEAEQQSLYNQGLSPDTPGYATQMQQFNQAKNDAYNQMFLQGHSQAVNDLVQQYEIPINAAQAWRSGGQIQQYQPNLGLVQTPQASVAAPNYQQAVQSNYQQQSANSNAQMGGLFGLGGQLLGLGGSLLSDRQDKTDIQSLGPDPQTGIPIHAFRYKGDPKSYPKTVGPMAQDVEKAAPDAVTTVGDHKVIRTARTLRGQSQNGN
jgi:hypothetical protein